MRSGIHNAFWRTRFLYRAVQTRRVEGRAANAAAETGRSVASKEVRNCSELPTDGDEVAAGVRRRQRRSSMALGSGSKLSGECRVVALSASGEPLPIAGMRLELELRLGTAATERGIEGTTWPLRAAAPDGGEASMEDGARRGWRAALERLRPSGEASRRGAVTAGLMVLAFAIGIVAAEPTLRSDGASSTGVAPPERRGAPEASHQGSAPPGVAPPAVRGRPTVSVEPRGAPDASAPPARPQPTPSTFAAPAAPTKARTRPSREQPQGGSTAPLATVPARRAAAAPPPVARAPGPPAAARPSAVAPPLAKSDLLDLFADTK